jgi:hypothetical protein
MMRIMVTPGGRQQTRFLVASLAGRRYKRQYRMETIIIIVIVVAVLATAGVVVYLRNRPPVEEPTYHFYCPRCHRKLRYRGKQAGKQGACPRCRQGFSFPLVPGQAAKT